MFWTSNRFRWYKLAQLKSNLPCPRLFFLKCHHSYFARFTDYRIHVKEKALLQLFPFPVLSKFKLFIWSVPEKGPSWLKKVKVRRALAQNLNHELCLNCLRKNRLFVWSWILVLDSRSLLAIHFKYSSAYMSISNSLITLPSGNHKFVLQVYVFWWVILCHNTWSP